MRYYGNFRGLDILKSNLKKECVFFKKTVTGKKGKKIFS